MKVFDFNHINDTNKLSRCRRWMLWIVGLCLFTSISMISGVATGLTFGFHTAELIIVCLSCVICLLTIVPSLFFFVWIDEIEKILKQRQVTFDRSFGQRLHRWVFKMMFWAILVVLLPMLMRIFIG